MNLKSIKFITSYKAKKALDKFVLDGYYEKTITALSRDLFRSGESIRRLTDACTEFEIQNECKRIALILVTTLLIVSLVGNAIQLYGC